MGLNDVTIVEKEKLRYSIINLLIAFFLVLSLQKTWHDHPSRINTYHNTIIGVCTDTHVIYQGFLVFRTKDLTWS